MDVSACRAVARVGADRAQRNVPALQGPVRSYYRRSKTTRAPRKRTFLVTMSKYSEQTNAPAEYVAVPSARVCKEKFTPPCQPFSKMGRDVTNGGGDCSAGGSDGGSGLVRCFFGGDGGHGATNVFGSGWVFLAALALSVAFQSCGVSHAQEPCGLISKPHVVPEWQNRDDLIIFGTVKLSPEEKLFFAPRQYRLREHKRVGY